VGPGCGIQEGSLDHVVVSFGVGLWFSEGNIGEESLVAAANIVTLGPSNSSILHRLEPSGVAHLLIAASLSKMWYHTLEFSIGSQEVQDYLLPVQIVGTIGIQIHIEVSHKYRSISGGRILIEGWLDMVMEVVQPFLLWQ